MAHWPQNDEEWAEAINAAVFCLGVDSARKYGLVSGGPEVDVDRCEEVLAHAKAAGLLIPTLEEVLR